MKLTKNEIIGLIQYTSGEIDLVDVTENDAESILKDYLEAINYTRCCKSDSELLSCDCPICGKKMTSQLVKHHHCKDCNEHYTTT